MKTRLILLFFAISGVVMLQSCEENLLDINQTFTYSNEFQVISDESTFATVQVVDLASQDSIIAEYGDKIKEINIKEVKYWLTAFEGEDDQAIVEATLKVADGNGANMLTIATIANKNLKALLDTPTPLEVNQEAINSMQELIKNAPHTFTLGFNSACNKAPLNFKVKFEFTIEMVANPL